MKNKFAGFFIKMILFLLLRINVDMTERLHEIYN